MNDLENSQGYSVIFAFRRLTLQCSGEYLWKLEMGAANTAPFLGLKKYVFFLRKLIFKESCITIGLVKNVTLYPKSGPSAKL